MTTTIYDTLRELVEWSAPPGTPVLSLYLDVAPGRAEAAVDFARLSCEELTEERDRPFVSLVRELLDTLPEIVADVRAADHDGLALFLCAEPPLNARVALRFPFENQARVGRTPFLRHLLTLAEEYERSMVLIASAGQVHMCDLHIGDLVNAREVRASQRRDLVDEVVATVARALRDEPATHLILMGAPDEREPLEKALPHDVQARIIDWIDDAPAPGDPELLRLVHRSLQAYERRTEAHGVARLLALREDGEEVAIGLAETLAAINKGKIHKLFTLQGYEHRGWLCDVCDTLGALPAPPACLACGASVSEVPLEEHLYAQAAACGAEIETVYASEPLARAGGIGATLDD
jgi:hypothetical protein